MKNLFLSVILLLGFILPTRSQVEPTMTEEAPMQTLTLKKGQIPPVISKATEDIFKEQANVNFGSLNDELKGFKWIETDGDLKNGPVDQYEIQFRTHNGIRGYATVSKDGNLISYRMTEANAGIPAQILNSISKSGYKDWGIVGETAKVTSQNNKVKAHYFVTLRKGDQKKTLAYDMNGRMLSKRS